MKGQKQKRLREARERAQDRRRRKFLKRVLTTSLYEALKEAQNGEKICPTETLAGSL